MRESHRGGVEDRRPGRASPKASSSHRRTRSRPPTAAVASVDAAAGREPGRTEVTLLNPRRYSEAKQAALKPWLARLLAALAPTADSFGVRLVSDREMHRLNLAHRSHDHTTDVLSFTGERTLEGWHLGDVVISVPQTRRQAEAAGQPVARELRLLLLHGILHCLGHDHEQDDGAMERLERRLRRRWLDGG
jgi:probable rRNA maturation factor